MPAVQRTLRAEELGGTVGLSTSYANGTYTIANPSVGILRAIHLVGAITAGVSLTIEVWDSTVDRQYVPATGVVVVAGTTAGVSSGVVLVDCAIPSSASLVLKAKLSAGTGTLTAATLIWEA